MAIAASGAPGPRVSPTQAQRLASQVPVGGLINPAIIVVAGAHVRIELINSSR